METSGGRKVVWDQMRRGEIETAARGEGVVLIPIGATEQHGPHLPLNTDTSAVLHVAMQAAQQITEFPVVVMPTISWGLSPHHMSFAGSITLSWQTFGALVTEICSCVHAHGFQKIVLLNGHGGNTGFLKGLVVELGGKGISVAQATYFELLSDEELRSLCQMDARVEHSGELETSMQLYLQPELVDLGKTSEASGTQTGEGYARTMFPGVSRPFNLRTHAPAGFRGNPAAGSPEKGERLLSLAVERLIAFLHQYQEEPF